MATIYKVEVVSHWISYTEEELQKLLENAIKHTLAKDLIRVRFELGQDLVLTVEDSGAGIPATVFTGKPPYRGQPAHQPSVH